MTEHRYTVSADVILHRVVWNENWKSEAGARKLCKLNEIRRRQVQNYKIITCKMLLERKLVTFANVNLINYTCSNQNSTF